MVTLFTIKNSPAVAPLISYLNKQKGDRELLTPSEERPKTYRNNSKAILVADQRKPKLEYGVYSIDGASIAHTGRLINDYINKEITREMEVSSTVKVGLTVFAIIKRGEFDNTGPEFLYILSNDKSHRPLTSKRARGKQTKIMYF